MPILFLREFLQHSPLDRERLTKHTVKRLEALGSEVTLTQREVDV